MQPDPDLDPEAPRAIAYRTRAADGTGGAVEGRDEAVTCRVDLATTESLQFGSHHGVVVIEASPPRAITEVGRMGSRVDDVGEKDCCEDPIEPLLDCPGAGEELPHGIEPASVSPVNTAASWPGKATSRASAMCDARYWAWSPTPVRRTPVDHQGRGGDRVQHSPNVGPPNGVEQLAALERGLRLGVSRERPSVATIRRGR